MACSSRSGLAISNMRLERIFGPARYTCRSRPLKIGVRPDISRRMQPPYHQRSSGQRCIMSRIRPTKFAHVVYRTRRFDQMLRWYQAVFHTNVQHQNPALAFLTYDDEHHRFAFANLDILQPEGTETERRGTIGVDHVAYTYASLHDLFENYSQLKAQGITPYWCVHHGVRCRCITPIPMGTRWSFRWRAIGRMKRPTRSWPARTSRPIRSASNRTRTTGSPGCAPARLSPIFSCARLTNRCRRCEAR